MTENPEPATLHTPQTPAKRRRRSRSRSRLGRMTTRIQHTIRWRIVIVTTLVMIVFALGFQLIRTSDGINNLRDSVNELERTLDVISSRSGTDLTLTDFERLRLSVQNVQNDIGSLKQSVRPVRGFIPAINLDWATTLDALDGAAELLAAVQDILTGIEPALFYMVNGQPEDAIVTQISSGERIVELMEIGQVRFVQASEHLESAQTLLANLDLADISQDLTLQVQQIENYYEQILEINTVMLNAPDLLTEILGLDEVQRYLILAQNSDELRPSGGYVSTYGWMTVRNGRIVDYDYYATTTETPSPPTQDVSELVTIPDWWIQYRQPIYAMWDGSWYADFPQTADMARRYYELGEGNPNTPIDGVIAIDVRGFEMLLGALESVGVDHTIDGEQRLVTITQDNFRDVIYNIRAYSDGAATHKTFIADVYDAIFSEWQTTSRNPDVSAALLGIALESLQLKHIMVYFVNEDINAVTEILGWNGSQTPAIDHDYLMVADANLGNKSNRSILRQLTYDVTINSDQTVNGRLAVAYDYADVIARDDPAIDPAFHGPIDYSNLMQVFVPQGATLTTHDNLGAEPRTVNTDAHTIFVSRVRVEYDTSQRYQLNYTMDGIIDTVGPYNRYRLLIQKQPGILSETVTVQVSLPTGTTLINVEPTPDAIFNIEDVILVFRIDLNVDTWLEIVFEPPDDID